MHLAADPAGQERLRHAIFAVADDRMADRRQMRAKLVGDAGIGLQLQPAGAVARPVDHTIARACGQAVLLVDVHLLAARSGLIATRQADDPAIGRASCEEREGQYVKITLVAVSVNRKKTQKY